jgi:hypothetical protein
MKKIFIIGILIIFIICSIVFIQVLRFTNSDFRYNFDVNFNQTKEHISYLENGENIVLPLPKKTTFAFKTSDSNVTYYTKLSYEEFIKFYKSNDMFIEENVVSYDNIKFIVKEKKDSGSNKSKYNFINIDIYSK